MIEWQNSNEFKSVSRLCVHSPYAIMTTLFSCIIVLNRTPLTSLRFTLSVVPLRVPRLFRIFRFFVYSACLSVFHPPSPIHLNYCCYSCYDFSFWLFSFFFFFRTETPECLTFEYMTKWKFSLLSLFSPYICFIIDNFYRNVIVFSFCSPAVFFLLSFLLLWWWKINNRGTNNTNKYAKTVFSHPTRPQGKTL